MTGRAAFPGWRPPAWVHVRVGTDGWVDTLTTPGTWRPHAAGTWLLLRADRYRALRLARMEEVERVLVPRTFRGRPYLHAVTCCGRLVDTPVRVNVPDVVYPAPQVAPPSPRARYDPEWQQQFVTRKGCGCGGSVR